MGYKKKCKCHEQPKEELPTPLTNKVVLTRLVEMSKEDGEWNEEARLIAIIHYLAMIGLRQ